jgi:hypothetical protein
MSEPGMTDEGAIVFMDPIVQPVHDPEKCVAVLARQTLNAFASEIMIPSRSI